MILKLLNYISGKRNLAFAVLMIPMFIGFYFAITRLSPYPKSHFYYVDITFDAPAKMARDLESLVSEKIEKTLNGVQGLISFETTTHHEKVQAHLMFNPSMDEDKIRLFLQEKLDVLKIQLGSVVREIKLDFIRPPETMIFSINSGKSTLTATEWKKWDEAGLKIKQIVPALISENRISIKPKLIGLVQFGMTLDQLTSALRLNGLTYQLGEKRGKSYYLEGRKENITDLKQTIVGEKDHRIIMLSDVATVTEELRSLPSNFSIYPLMNLRIDEVEGLKNELITIFGKESLTDHRLLNSWLILSVHLYEIIFIVGVFAVIFFLVFNHFLSSVSVVIFSLFFIGQFLFWTGLKGEKISPLHFEAINVSLIMGLFLWGIYLARIRSYFLPHKLEVFIQRKLGQAILFTFVEFLPTLLTIMALFLVFSLPLLLGDFSPISKELIHLILILSFPLLLSLLLIMSLFTPLEWIKKSQFKAFGIFPNKLKGDISLKWLLPFLMLLFISPWIKDKVMYRLDGTDAFVDKDWSDYLRGYGPRALYFASNNKLSNHLKIVKQTEFQMIQEWWITPNGLHQLEGRKLFNFQKSLEDYSLSARVLNLTTGDPVLISFPTTMQADDFGHLLVAGNENKPSIYLKQIARPVFENREKVIIRSQMDRRILAVRKDTAEFPLLKKAGLQMTALTLRLEGEYNSYKRNFWTVALFSLIIFSLYFNSFVRGTMALIFSQTFLILPSVLAFLGGFTLPVDSLYLSTLVGWFPVVLLLFLSRSVDIERLRGNEKESSVSVVSTHVYSALSALSVGLIVSLFCWPLISKSGLNDLPKTMVDLGSYYATFTLLALYLLFSSAFRLFYISTEKHIDRLIIKVARYYYRFKKS